MRSASKIRLQVAQSVNGSKKCEETKSLDQLIVTKWKDRSPDRRSSRTGTAGR